MDLGDMENGRRQGMGKRRRLSVLYEGIMDITGVGREKTYSLKGPEGAGGRKVRKSMASTWAPGRLGRRIG